MPPLVLDTREGKCGLCDKACEAGDIVKQDDGGVYIHSACEYAGIVGTEHGNLSGLFDIDSEAMQRWRKKFYSALTKAKVQIDIQGNAQESSPVTHDKENDEDNTPRVHLPLLPAKYIPPEKLSTTKAAQAKHEQAKILNPEPRCSICRRDLSSLRFLLDSTGPEKVHLACKVARLVENMVLDARRSIPEIETRADIWTDELDGRLKQMLGVPIPTEGKGEKATTSINSDPDLLDNWRWMMTSTRVASIQKELDELQQFGKLDDLFTGFPNVTSQQRLEISRAAITGVANIMREQGFTGETTRRSICTIAACLILDLGQSQEVNFHLNPEAAAATVVGMFQSSNRWFTGQAHRLVCGIAKVDAKVLGLFPTALDLERSGPLLAEPTTMLKFWSDMNKAAAIFTTSKEDQSELAASFYGATILCGIASEHAARRDPPKAKQRAKVPVTKKTGKSAEERLHGDSKAVAEATDVPASSKGATKKRRSSRVRTETDGDSDSEFEVEKGENSPPLPVKSKRRKAATSKPLLGQDVHTAETSAGPVNKDGESPTESKGQRRRTTRISGARAVQDETQIADESHTAERSGAVLDTAVVVPVHEDERETEGRGAPITMPTGTVLTEPTDALAPITGQSRGAQSPARSVLPSPSRGSGGPSLSTLSPSKARGNTLGLKRSATAALHDSDEEEFRQAKDSDTNGAAKRHRKGVASHDDAARVVQKPRVYVTGGSESGERKDVESALKRHPGIVLLNDGTRRGSGASSNPTHVIVLPGTFTGGKVIHGIATGAYFVDKSWIDASDRQDARGLEKHQAIASKIIGDVALERNRQKAISSPVFSGMSFHIHKEVADMKELYEEAIRAAGGRVERFSTMRALRGVNTDGKVYAVFDKRPASIDTGMSGDDAKRPTIIHRTLISKAIKTHDASLLDGESSWPDGLHNTSQASSGNANDARAKRKR